MTHLYLIRHGEALTEANGIANDYGLTPLGINQAERLRDRLAASSEIHADVLIASTLPRARQTAEIVAPALGLPIIFDDDVQEQRPGSLRGMRIEEVRALFAELKPERDPFVSVAPGAESWAEFTLRVGNTLHRILREHAGKTIVIVCHGGIIDNAFTYFLGLDSLHIPTTGFFTQNTSITYWRKIAADSEREDAYWHLVFYNDVMHLRDLNASERIPWQALRIQPQKEESHQPLTPPAEE